MRMEKEKGISLNELLAGLLEGRVLTIPMHQHRELEVIKEAAFLLMGPLCVGVNIQREVYKVQRDRTKEYLKHPSRWY